MRTLRTFSGCLLFTALTGTLVAQDPASEGRWRRVDEPAPPAVAAAPAPAPAPAPTYGEPLDAYGNPQGGGAPQQQGAPMYQPAPAQTAAPGQLTIQPGTYLTVRVNQVLSSDRNQPGDAFTATLAGPVVVDGVVVAQRGQTIGGRVSEAEKAGRIKGTSRLGIELTDLSLADGQRVPVRTQLVTRSGNTSVGGDAVAVGTTTALGAAVGAAADWGRGAAIGAGAGAAAGLIGVLLTRGHATEVYPEQVLTFRVEAPITVNTTRAPQAFHYVSQGDYEQHAPTLQRRAPVAVAAPAPYYYPGWWGPSYYGPGFWGPSIGFYYGRSYGRGWRRW